MEPPLAVQASGPITPHDHFGANETLTRYQLLLSNYFPKGHWSQLQPPKVVASSNEQAMLVMDDYERIVPSAGAKHRRYSSNSPLATQVKIERFALLVFPTPPREGINPPQDAIILEAPQGASLDFDDFRPERGHIGQITRGLFPVESRSAAACTIPAPKTTCSWRPPTWR